MLLSSAAGLAAVIFMGTLPAMAQTGIRETRPANDKERLLTMEEAVGGVLTCFNNVGPGLEIVGPMGSFADFSPWCKWLLSFDMLAGRLELFPMLALFSPRTWRPHRAPRTVVHL